ncbi:hypothetical protein GUJ93_ZPchr0010g11108 [Zizania palustris]|uniref:non-specific serine/threonine protein kinase n=1 Tax=Zizania palustris TaxID=103762 RepID=A0A8J5W905_ZIZPA|nr:hypothetical protein GUJ93_ZPchr0010g11108 [Zizania palustris]
MSLPIAVVAGVTAGGAILFSVAAAVIALWWAARIRARRNHNSETGSSDPSTLGELPLLWFFFLFFLLLSLSSLWTATVLMCRDDVSFHWANASCNVPVEWGKGGRSSTAPEHQGARQFSLDELAQATKYFSEANLVGVGSFGLVYKGLLLDGTIFAIKKRCGAPRQEFAEEVRELSEITHRNIVTLIGYCQEGGLQLLVYEYLLNGSVCGHLYDTGKGSNSMTRLEFKQRLSIAIGAAKGLNHLHTLVPPLIHKDFKTSNVLVDENFIAKVADAGLVRLHRGYEDVGPSHRFSSSVYQDPEVQLVTQFSESSDVYSFGVFLMELITGREATSLISPDSRESLAHWVEQDVETVINVLQPGPVGIVEHKFTDAEIRAAGATVRQAVENWRRNCTLERNLGSDSFHKWK